MYFLYYYNYTDLHFIRLPSFAILVLKPVPRQDMPKRQKISQYHERPRKVKKIKLDSRSNKPINQIRMCQHSNEPHERVFYGPPFDLE